MRHGVPKTSHNLQNHSHEMIQNDMMPLRAIAASQSPLPGRIVVCSGATPLLDRGAVAHGATHPKTAQTRIGARPFLDNTSEPWFERSRLAFGRF